MNASLVQAIKSAIVQNATTIISKKRGSNLLYEQIEILCILAVLAISVGIASCYLSKNNKEKPEPVISFKNPLADLNKSTVDIKRTL